MAMPGSEFTKIKAAATLAKGTKRVERGPGSSSLGIGVGVNRVAERSGGHGDSALMGRERA